MPTKYSPRWPSWNDSGLNQAAAGTPSGYADCNTQACCLFWYDKILQPFSQEIPMRATLDMNICRVFGRRSTKPVSFLNYENEIPEYRKPAEFWSRTHAGASHGPGNRIMAGDCAATCQPRRETQDHCKPDLKAGKVLQDKSGGICPWSMMFAGIECRNLFKRSAKIATASRRYGCLDSTAGCSNFAGSFSGLLLAGCTQWV